MRLTHRAAATAVSVAALVVIPLLGAAPAAADSGPVFKVKSLSTRAAAPSVTVTSPTAGSLSAVDAYENRLFDLTNKARTSRGLRPLVKSGCATTIAGSYAQRLAQLGRLVHNSMSLVAGRCGASAAGENIAFGNVTADQMFQMWMNSAPHRSNLLRADYAAMGMGAYKTSSGRWYGVQNFLRA